MRKKQTLFRGKYRSQEYLFIAAGIAIICGIVGYFIGTKHNVTYKAPTKNKAGYIVAQQAKEQVNNFYRQYIKDYDNPHFFLYLLRGYGSGNLIFYNSYYQHGFDPITCSTLAPVSVTVSSAIPGTVATVYADLRYIDHSFSTVKATVVINNDGLKIDSITCPGNKGNLPPRV